MLHVTHTSPRRRSVHVVITNPPPQKKTFPKIFSGDFNTDLDDLDAISQVAARFGLSRVGMDGDAAVTAHADGRLTTIDHLFCTSPGLTIADGTSAITTDNSDHDGPEEEGAPMDAAGGDGGARGDAAAGLMEVVATRAQIVPQADEDRTVCVPYGTTWPSDHFALLFDLTLVGAVASLDAATDGGGAEGDESP